MHFIDIFSQKITSNEEKIQ